MAATNMMASRVRREPSRRKAATTMINVGKTT